jgi:hypothetical protein
MRTLLTPLIFAISLWGAAAPKSPASGAAPAGKARAGPSDAEIERDIRARFARSKISADGFQVRVAGGVATLEGSTDVIQRKGVATRLAKLGGAARVVNRIQVSEAARARAARNLAKGRRRAQVKRGETTPRSQSRSGP